MSDLKFEPINVFDGKSLRHAADSHEKGVPLKAVTVKKTAATGDSTGGSWKLEPFFASVVVNRGPRVGKVFEKVEMLVTCPELDLHEPYGTELDMPPEQQEGSIVLLVSIESLISKAQKNGTLTLEVSCGGTKLPTKQLPVEFVEVK